MEVTIKRAARKFLDEKPNETWDAGDACKVPCAVKIEAHADNDGNQDDSKMVLSICRMMSSSPQKKSMREGWISLSTTSASTGKRLEPSNKKKSKTGNLQGVVRLLEDVHIGLAPLLNEPQGSQHTDCIQGLKARKYSICGRRVKGRVRQWGIIFGRDLVAD
jgi:hypothetical protein